MKQQSDTLKLTINNVPRDIAETMKFIASTQFHCSREEMIIRLWKQQFGEAARKLISVNEHLPSEDVTWVKDAQE